MNRSWHFWVAMTSLALLAAACADSPPVTPTTSDLLAQAGFVRRDVDPRNALPR